MFFVTGIDTDIGKSVITGLLARFLRSSNVDCISAKLVQTGCTGMSEDILTHRKLEGAEPRPEDYTGETCPYMFKFPASPHLAAEMEGINIYPEYITACVNKLAKTHDCVLLEGAGGLMVPLTRNLLTADFVSEQGWPLIVVCSGRLGSINHSLLTLEAAQRRNIPLAGVVYNEYPPEKPEIGKDSKTVIKDYLKSNNINAPFIEAPAIEDLNNPPSADFGEIFRELL
ncbi:MAG: dethiobiotin synthase [Victivallaceae bacterium]|nr:dethiobiotin synthase [Victivallaceae bacterium]